ncbi:MAG: hypothetical protein WCK01_02720 [Candidatus Uhrbacteria bacterium]
MQTLVSSNVVDITRYRHKVRKPVARIEKQTDVQEIAPKIGVKRRHKPVGPTRLVLKAKLRQSMAALSGAFKLRVLNQFVRCVIGKDGLEEHLIESVKRRLRATSRQKAEMTFDRAWNEQLNLLVVQARAYIETAERTGDTTGRGYVILHGIGFRGRPVFITLHDLHNVVVGIYSGKQWNHKRSHRAERVESHYQARAFRKQKAGLSPR